MILQLTFRNPIINCLDVLIINYPEINAIEWKYHNINNWDENNIISTLNIMLNTNLNCKEVYNNKQIRNTTSMNYKKAQSWYWWYLLKINNQLLYNKYIDKLIEKHVDNIVFEDKFNKNVINSIKPKHKTKKKNEFKQYISRDIFDNSINYIYINDKTGEQIISKDKELLNKLNKPKKIKQNKEQELPLESMMFKI